MERIATGLIGNIVLFQVAWFSFILQWHNGLLGWIFIMLLVANNACSRKLINQEITFVCIVVITGVLSDSLLIYYSYYEFPGYIKSIVPPLWLIGLWIGFSLTLNYSLSWVFKKPYLPPLVFTLFGPLSYLAGEKLGAINISQGSILFMLFQWLFLSVVFLFSYNLLFKKVTRYEIE